MRIVLNILLFFLPTLLYAQIVYPIVGQYNNCSAQGMAICGDIAYLFNDGGLCRKLNLKTGIVDGVFYLECAGQNTHVNCVCFGKTVVSEEFSPVLYITEFYGKRRCFVEVIKNKSKLIQTIEYVNHENKNPFVRDWLVDNKKRMLYAVVREDNRQEVNVIKKFSLPEVIEGSTVVLTDEDVLDEFSINFRNGIQGGKIVGHYMYLVTGFSALQGDGEFYNREI